MRRTKTHVKRLNTKIGKLDIGGRGLVRCPPKKYDIKINKCLTKNTHRHCREEERSQDCLQTSLRKICPVVFAQPRDTFHLLQLKSKSATTVMEIQIQCSSITLEGDQATGESQTSQKDKHINLCTDKASS